MSEDFSKYVEPIPSLEEVDQAIREYGKLRDSRLVPIEAGEICQIFVWLRAALTGSTKS